MLKFALNKSMGASDDEQGISKLWPYGILLNISKDMSVSYNGF